eukprot:TRINITY_DN628_c0_g1_i2.p1 TRINITY_DN628_c0_g1~~TRINITY_DN628_c0_g1_i2.p1  ORF type:complete len:561 (+),score=125.24 TRINITY_DN628_c0_g1_i2:41-1684(+)
MDDEHAVTQGDINQRFVDVFSYRPFDFKNDGQYGGKFPKSAFPDGDLDLHRTVIHCRFPFHPPCSRMDYDDNKDDTILHFSDYTLLSGWDDLEIALFVRNSNPTVAQSVSLSPLHANPGADQPQNMMSLEVCEDFPENEPETEPETTMEVEVADENVERRNGNEKTEGVVEVVGPDFAAARLVGDGKCVLMRMENGSQIKVGQEWRQIENARALKLYFCFSSAFVSFGIGLRGMPLSNSRDALYEELQRTGNNLKSVFRLFVEFVLSPGSLAGFTKEKPSEKRQKNADGDFEAYDDFLSFFRFLFFSLQRNLRQIGLSLDRPVKGEKSVDTIAIKGSWNQQSLEKLWDRVELEEEEADKSEAENEEMGDEEQMEELEELEELVMSEDGMETEEIGEDGMEVMGDLMEQEDTGQEDLVEEEEAEEPEPGTLEENLEKELAEWNRLIFTQPGKVTTAFDDALFTASIQKYVQSNEEPLLELVEQWMDDEKRTKVLFDKEVVLSVHDEEGTLTGGYLFLYVSLLLVFSMTHLHSLSHTHTLPPLSLSLSS